MPTLDYETPPPAEPVTLKLRLKWLLIASITYLAILSAIIGIVALASYVP